jgi:hypothetical protein
MLRVRMYSERVNRKTKKLIKSTSLIIKLLPEDYSTNFLCQWLCNLCRHGTHALTAPTFSKCMLLEQEFIILCPSLLSPTMGMGSAVSFRSGSGRNPAARRFGEFSTKRVTFWHDSCMSVPLLAYLSYVNLLCAAFACRYVTYLHWSYGCDLYDDQFRWSMGAGAV